jgi:nucleoside-diphosphate-sugar epimerase
MTDVRDVTSALLSLYDVIENNNGQVFNISGGQSISIYELMTALAKARQKSIKFVQLPLGIILPLAYMTEAIYRILPRNLEPRLTPYLLATMAFSQTFDLTKAKRLLGYEPKYNPTQTLIDLVRSMP